MMPAKSTSDHRTYSSMMNGPGWAGGGADAMPREARRLRGGAKAFQPVGFEPAPQRRATDPQAARGLGELALGVLERVEDRQALAVGEGLGPGRGEDRRFAEGLGTAPQ